jgi:hypothetical protein
MLTSLVRTLCLVSLLVAGVMTAAETGPTAAQGQGKVYVGRVAGAENIDALVAVSVGADGTAIAYLCSKDDTWNQQNSKWFTGRLTDAGALTATARDGTEIVAILTGNELTGTAGNLRWKADLVTGGTAGLYRGQTPEEVHGVIEAVDGTTVGRVWSVVTGGHVCTWDFSTATVQRAPNIMRAQPQGQFVFIELRSCNSPFDCEF